jgi:Transposase
MVRVGASCTTSVFRCVIDRANCKLFTPSITASLAVRTLTQTWRTWLRPVVTTPAGSSAWQAVWWSRTVCPTELLRGTSGGTTGFSSLSPRFKTGSRRLEKKSAAHAETDYLDWALEDFSGYLAADELYDGPFCVLSAVDARQQRRLLYKVLDHDPTQADVLLFLTRLNKQIIARGHAVLGITTDGSSLYPLPISQAFGAIPHQICKFHVLKELTKAVLHVLARLRKRLTGETPKLPRGRTRNAPEAQRLCRQARSLGQRVTALFEKRYLFVRHYPTVAERATLLHLTRGQPQLRVLRVIMDEVYRLFDRRCRTDTALTKLAHLRQRVRRYRNLGKSLDKLHSPNLEKALTFLDDRLMPATSNAVERGNRRLRKMQKTVYRVRTQESLQGRLALDLQRDQHANDRQQTLSTLHETRE